MTVQAHRIRRIDLLLAEYDESHQNPTNKAIHCFTVPVIAWAMLAVLWVLPTPGFFSGMPYLNWATIVCALAVIYYLTLSIPLAIGMALFSLIAIAIIQQVDASIYASISIKLEWIAGALIVNACVFQFVGRVVEGNKPSFFKALQFLLIGPAWVTHLLFHRLGIRY